MSVYIPPSNKSNRYRRTSDFCAETQFTTVFAGRTTHQDPRWKSIPHDLHSAPSEMFLHIRLGITVSVSLQAASTLIVAHLSVIRLQSQPSSKALPLLQPCTSAESFKLESLSVCHIFFTERQFAKEGRVLESSEVVESAAERPCNRFCLILSGKATEANSVS